MPADETFGAPIVEQIDGRDVSFPRLYMDFYGTLEGVVRNAKIAIERSALDECRVTGKDRSDAIAKVAREPVMPDDVDVYLATESGAKKVLTKSLETAGVPHTDIPGILTKLDFSRANFIARLVMGFLRPVPADVAQSEVPVEPASIKERDWDGEWLLIQKHFPGQGKLTWHQYHLCLARAQVLDRAEQQNK